MPHRTDYIYATIQKTNPNKYTWMRVWATWVQGLLIALQPLRRQK